MKKSIKKKIKIGIILDSEFIDKEYYNLLLEILNNKEDFEKPVIVIQGGKFGLVDRSSAFIKIFKIVKRFEFLTLIKRLLKSNF